MNEMIHNIKLAFSASYRKQFIPPCPKQKDAPLNCDKLHRDHLAHYKTLGALITRLEHIQH